VIVSNRIQHNAEVLYKTLRIFALQHKYDNEIFVFNYSFINQLFKIQILNYEMKNHYLG
jgi:hypothetical protein